MAIFRSTARFRHCASAPDIEDAVMWLAVVATATDEGMPVKISSGVSRNPPPTPSRPERNPMAPPSPRMTSQRTDISAMGR
ncbi:MAG: hypothetical protein WDM89_00420 [Rhizomicrobium sp.]